MRSTAFGKITAVYGQIAENGSSVRKWPARKVPITDKMVKNGSLSVNLSEILAKIGRAASPFWKRQLFHTQKARLSKDKGP